MVSYLTATLEEEQYYCKALADDTIKISVYTSDSYRRLIKQFQADNVIHHNYQPRGERAYRVVLRHFHHSIHPNVIKGDLEGLGHTVRNVLNIHHRLTKALCLSILWILNRAITTRVSTTFNPYVT
jgi:hypothetical protein